MSRIKRAVADPRWAVQSTVKTVRALARDLTVGLRARDPEAFRIGSWNHGNLPRVPLDEAFPGIQSCGIHIQNAMDRVVGWSVDVNEIAMICALVQYSQARNILEIGTYDGNTALNLAANCPDDATVTTIDLPPDWDGKLDIDVPSHKQNVTDRAQIGRQFRGSPLESKIRQVYADSAALDWKTDLDAPFDFIFIDGCHHYDYVKRDTVNAIAAGVPGAYVVWHDYGHMPDVSRVVDEFAERMNTKVLRGSRLAVGRVPATNG